MTTSFEVLQVMSEAGSEQEAAQQLQGHLALHDCLGGRVLQPGPGKPRWRVQAFFGTQGLDKDMPLPEGERWVVIVPSLADSLGIRKEVAA